MEGLQQEYWNDLAGPKWAASQALMDDALAPYADVLRDCLALGPEARIVDVGCGCGATTLIAHRCAPGAEIIGLDVSEPMLEVARRRASRLRDHRIRFVHDDAATSQAIEPGSVDRLVSRFGVMFFGEPEVAYAQMRRWLKPEGRMVVVVWAPREDNPWMGDPMAAMKKHIDLPPPDPNAPGPFAMGDANKRAAIFAAAGLRVEEERVVTTPMRVRGDVDQVIQFFGERGPAALALQNASEADREAAMEALREYVLSVHDGRGASMPGKALRLTLAPEPDAASTPPEVAGASSQDDDEGP